MTLAAAILFFISFTSSDAIFVTRPAQQSNPPAGPASAQQTPSTQTGPDTTKPASTRPSKATVNKPKDATAKKSQPKDPVVPDPSCDARSANASASSSNNSPAPPPPDSAQTAAEPQKNCPPAKKVVRQGGISEQSIQLAGASSGGEATQKRESTSQMLTATEENLKKVATIQLSTAQQSSISQIRQFVDQSKKALKAADFERAHTLAWKAKVLSDDLANPK